MPNEIQLVVLFILLFLITLSDLKYQLIPNKLVYLGIIIGVALSFLFSGFPGLQKTLLSFLLGLSIFFPFYYVSAMGGGDIKLMAMCGTFLDPTYIIITGILSLLSGGIFAMLILIMNKWNKFVNDSYLHIFFNVNACKSSTHCLNTNNTSSPTHIPFAPSITCGIIIAVVDPHFIQPLKQLLG